MKDDTKAALFLINKVAKTTRKTAKLCMGMVRDIDIITTAVQRHDDDIEKLNVKTIAEYLRVDTHSADIAEISAVLEQHEDNLAELNGIVEKHAGALDADKVMISALQASLVAQEKRLVALETFKAELAKDFSEVAAAAAVFLLWKLKSDKQITDLQNENRTKSKRIEELSALTADLISRLYKMDDVLEMLAAGSEVES